VRLQIRDLAALLAEQNLDLSVEEPVVQRLAAAGYEPEYGARPLRRVLRRRIENPLATHLLEDRFRGCSGVLIEAVAASEGEAGSLRFVPRLNQGEDVR